MAEVRKINPELASHNIAEAFSRQYIANLSNLNDVLDINGTDIVNASKYAAQLYAIAYDVAYEYFLESNSDLDEDSE